MWNTRLLNKGSFFSLLSVTSLAEPLRASPASLILQIRHLVVPCAEMNAHNSPAGLQPVL